MDIGLASNARNTEMRKRNGHELRETVVTTIGRDAWLAIGVSKYSSYA